MKTQILSLFALGTAALSCQAFTIDFNLPEVAPGTTVTSGSPLIVNVAGYGDVRFEVAPTVTLEIDDTYSNDGGTTFQYSLELDASEAVIVTFLGPTAINVDFDIIGVTAGENTAPTYFPLSDEYQYSPGGGGDGAGIAAISWDAVPEPSSTLMVILGAGSLILLRKRA